MPFSFIATSSRCQSDSNICQTVFALQFQRHQLSLPIEPSHRSIADHLSPSVSSPPPLAAQRTLPSRGPSLPFSFIATNSRCPSDVTNSHPVLAPNREGQQPSLPISFHSNSADDDVVPSVSVPRTLVPHRTPPNHIASSSFTFFHIHPSSPAALPHTPTPLHTHIQ